VTLVQDSGLHLDLNGRPPAPGLPEAGGLQPDTTALEAALRAGRTNRTRGRRGRGSVALGRHADDGHARTLHMLGLVSTGDADRVRHGRGGTDRAAGAGTGAARETVGAARSLKAGLTGRTPARRSTQNTSRPFS